MKFRVPGAGAVYAVCARPRPERLAEKDVVGRVPGADSGVRGVRGHAADAADAAVPGRPEASASPAPAQLPAPYATARAGWPCDGVQQHRVKRSRSAPGPLLPRGRRVGVVVGWCGSL